ncbi:MAG: hypothetical protein WD740_04940 [Anaerolineales bacterium]
MENKNSRSIHLRQKFFTLLIMASLLLQACGSGAFVNQEPNENAANQATADPTHAWGT